MATSVDPDWLKRELIVRGLNTRSLADQGFSPSTVTRLLHGRPVLAGTLLKLDSLLTSTPPVPGYEYVLKGMSKDTDST